MRKSIALFVAGLIFGLVALAHLMRIVYNIEITTAGHIVPMGVSYIGFVVALVLSLWMFFARK